MIEATYLRPFLSLDILGRTKPHALHVAAATDFQTGAPRALDGLGQREGLLPYCYDADAERVLYTDMPDIEAALAAPFLYQAQFSGAARLVSVPLERMLDLETGPGMAPTFVLSISRCGSTLLSMLLRHAQCPVASEPDLYTQVAGLSGLDRAQLGEAGRQALVRGCTAALARQIGPEVVVKLRDHCNDIAELLAHAVPEARMAFMMRDRAGWARSRHRAFQDPPQGLADLLKRGVQTFDALVRAGRRPLLIWYEDLIADPAATLRRLGVPAQALEPVDLTALLRHDAQEGTAVSRHAIAASRAPDGVVEAFEAIWRQIAPRALLRTHGLERLWPADAD